MFVVFTADDAIQSYTINAVNQFLEKVCRLTSLNHRGLPSISDTVSFAQFWSYSEGTQTTAQSRCKPSFSIAAWRVWRRIELF
jgi:hypothetical protein